MLNELALDPKLESFLPFDNEKQMAFLAHVMNWSDAKLFLQVKDRIKGEWFSDPWCAQLFDSYVKFFNEVHRTPLGIQELMGWEGLRSLPQQNKVKLLNTETKCRSFQERFGADLLSNELTIWLRCRIFHENVSESAKLFNAKKFNNAFNVLEKTVKEYNTIRFDGAPAADFSDPAVLARQQQLDYQGACTTGIDIMDKKLNPDCPTGSLLKGDTTVLLAPVNVGKTTTMMTIAIHNVRAGKKVLFISHEGRESDIMEKFWIGTLKVSRQEFRRMSLSDNQADKTALAINGACLKANLTYLSMNTPGLTVEEVVSVIRNHQNKLKTTSETAQGFDLVVIDYPAILGTEMARGGKFEVRHIYDYVYRQFVQLALDEKFHCLVAAQTNRNGSKVNRNIEGEENRLLTLEDFAESFAIAMAATNVITVNRDEKAKGNNVITFYICKSRSSETGIAIACKSNFSYGISHSNELGGTAYRSSQSMSDRIASFIEQYKGKDTPESYLYA